MASLGLELGEGRKRVKDYRRFSRVIIAAGGEDYIARLCRSLTADQLQDTNNLPQKLEDTDILVVPVLLTSTSSVGDTKEFWQQVKPLKATEIWT